MIDWDKEVNKILPSNQLPLLRSLVNRTIVQATRHCWKTPEELVKRSQIPESDCFGKSVGYLAVELDDGSIIGFSDIESLNSVLCWVERDVDGVMYSIGPEDDDDDFPIDATDQRWSNPFMAAMKGSVITAVEILKESPRTARYDQLPNEVAIRLFTSSGAFWLTHSLHELGESFSVLLDGQLDPSVVPTLSVVWRYPPVNGEK